MKKKGLETRVESVKAMNVDKAYFIDTCLSLTRGDMFDQRLMNVSYGTGSKTQSVDRVKRNERE